MKLLKVSAATDSCDATFSDHSKVHVLQSVDESGGSTTKILEEERKFPLRRPDEFTY
jgi:hypothetical protein